MSTVALQRTAVVFVLATVVAAVFAFVPPVLAHEEVDHATEEEAATHATKDAESGETNLEARVRAGNVNTVLWVTLALEILVGIAVLGSSGGRVLRSGMRKVLFGGIVLVAVAATAYIAGSTIYLNVISVTKGPVHWHADFRILNCGEEVDILDPSGFSNKAGTSVLHEHGDNRIHVEGVVVEHDEAHLGTFFGAIGGEMTDTSLRVPTNEGDVLLQTGDRCADGSAGILQVFLWETDESGDTWVARQRKLDNPEKYLMKPTSLVPPGDCLVIELSPEKDQTNRVCAQYEVAEIRGDMIIER